MFKAAVVVYKGIHEIAPTYLSELVRDANLPERRSLHTARSIRLLVPSIRLSTIGDWVFPVASPSI